MRRQNTEDHNWTRWTLTLKKNTSNLRSSFKVDHILHPYKKPQMKLLFCKPGRQDLDIIPNLSSIYQPATLHRTVQLWEHGKKPFRILNKNNLNKL
jgi:hypothetical protein